jgi:hypothetical protein
VGEIFNKVLKYCFAVLAISLLPGTGFLQAQTVVKHLYLSDPSQALDRVDPVATADETIFVKGDAGAAAKVH